ncbi:MAG: DM13 domain-containing protein [Actinobacteria bacterium]|nr:DM13 domain-containing protein [Actinomycetota bacterium]
MITAVKIDDASRALPVVDGAAAEQGNRMGGRRRNHELLRRVAGAVVLVLMGASAAYSANVGGLRDRYRPPATYLSGRAPAAPSVAAADGPAIVTDAPVARAAHDIRSQPWWQPRTTLRGDGATTTETVTVDRHALQWRVKWRCSQGSFSAVPVAASGAAASRPLAQAACPAEGTGFSVKTGAFAHAASAPHHRLAFLKATAGSMNYEIPADVDVARYRSIVIWCDLTSNAYAAATLAPTQ